MIQVMTLYFDFDLLKSERESFDLDPTVQIVRVPVVSNTFWIHDKWPLPREKIDKKMLKSFSYLMFKLEGIGCSWA